MGDKMIVESDSPAALNKRMRSLDKFSDRSKSTSPIRSSSIGQRFGPDALELIRRLSDKRDVETDAFLLINANEVLAKDGIHGRIAEIGVGFGTGRHTMTRRTEYYHKNKVDDDSKIRSILNNRNVNTSQSNERKVFTATASKPVKPPKEEVRPVS
jgi:hypothetical protein